jgi:hypothetical protein
MATDGAILSFCEITSAEPAVAVRCLEMADGDVEGAVQLFFEHPELRQVVASTPAAARAGRPAIGREDAEGVINLDSDEDDDGNDDDGDAGVHAAARTAQEDEDAAMARRLQEEMYTGPGAGGGDDDDVRSPIARRHETLVGDDWGDNTAFDEQPPSSAMQDMARRMRRAVQAASTPNPFNQSIWTDPVTASTSTNDDGPASEDALSNPTTTRTYGNSHQQRLAELFRPPFDIMQRLDWDEAREDGKEMKRWILVNLQDMAIFPCQALNRDIWSNAAIKDVVRENFIFLQYSRQDMLAQKYIGFYFPSQTHENPDIYPHVCIVDPRTGEQVKVWSGVPFPSAKDFHAQLMEFLERYSLSSGSKNPVVKMVQRTRTIDVDRMTEDEMLEMALKNSLAAEGGGSDAPQSGGRGSSSSGGKGKKAAAAAVDPDALAREERQRESTPARDPTPPPAPASALSQISSTAPHAEPAAAAGPAVTRIQFRHPTGRVIRRFLATDPVRRIYEWLKAEPDAIDGMVPGAEFELKAMPEGVDLIEKLDVQIADAGLKNGTVMVEFISE